MFPTLPLAGLGSVPVPRCPGEEGSQTGFDGELLLTLLLLPSAFQMQRDLTGCVRRNMRQNEVQRLAWAVTREHGRSLHSHCASFVAAFVPEGVYVSVIPPQSQMGNWMCDLPMFS